MNAPPPLLPMVPPVNHPVPGGRGTRVQGGLMIVLGLGLSVAMALVAFWLYQAIALPALSARPSRWHGGPKSTRTTFELFGTIFLFGLVCLGGGTFEVCTGRRSRLLLIPLLLLVGTPSHAANAMFLGLPIHFVMPTSRAWNCGNCATSPPWPPTAASAGPPATCT